MDLVDIRIKQLSLRLLHRLDFKLLWNIYAKKCNQLMLKQSLFIFSFDCDTEEDIEVVLEVHKKLQSINITPVYAVPGELLKKGKEVYKKIYQTGAEFINHGGRSHTYFDADLDRHTSCFFYDKQSYKTLRDDILLGHQILKDVLGITPQGWRTPHFGTFQRPQHLRFLYDVLKELRYTFSSSTNPAMAYLNGPLYKTNQLIEIPVTGIYSEPFNIMDTWAFFASPGRINQPEDYLKAARNLASFAAARPILINIYGDPSHIYNKPEFFQAMECLVQCAKNINYRQLLKHYI
jgi:hypothetical protein